MRDHLRRLTAICCGVALCLTWTASAQIFSPLHIFSTATGSTAPLIQGPDGTLCGVSALGGASGPPASGSVFRVQPDGSGFGILYSFTNGTDGAGPMAGLVLSGNTLYGTTKNGGSGAHGTVFKVNTDGSSFTTIYSFTAYTPNTNSDGASPLGSLVLSGSTLYGTTYAGGGAGAGGIVFKIDTSGTGFAALHIFSATVSGTNVDGAHSKAGLVLSGGILYGTTSAGGRGYGSVFSLNPADSSFTNLYNFTNGVDGGTPVAALAVSGGTLYGTTSSGANFPCYGTVFKLNSDGTGFTNLYEFAQGVGGTQPAAGLLVSGSTLYGTTMHTSGGAGGTVFRLGTEGTGFTVIANGSDGATAGV